MDFVLQRYSVQRTERLKGKYLGLINALFGQKVVIYGGGAN